MGINTKKYIPFSRPLIGREEIAEVVDTLKSGWLSTGPKTAKFEERFAKYIGVKYAVGLSSCTDALLLALLAHDIGSGDEVILPSFTFAACANMIVNVGARPVFADIEDQYFTIDPKDIEKRITKKTKAIMIVHYAGHPCNIEAIARIAKKYNLTIIEDAAHAVGSKYRGKKVGSFSSTTCFSFYPTKNITTGEGGMLVTNNKEVADFVRKNRIHGMSKDGWKRYEKGTSWRYSIDSPGWKCHMTDMQASLGLHQLKKLDHFIAIRNDYASLYDAAFKGNKRICIPKKAKHVHHAYHLYSILVKGFSRDIFIEKLAKQNIGTTVCFIPLHLQSYYRKEFGYKKGDLPVTERVFKDIVSLPLYPAMKKVEVHYVITQVMSTLS